jgi:hypothetical protein
MSGVLGSMLAQRLMQGNFTGTAALQDRPIPQPTSWAAPVAGGGAMPPLGQGPQFFGTFPSVYKPPAAAAPVAPAAGPMDWYNSQSGGN